MVADIFQFNILGLSSIGGHLIFNNFVKYGFVISLKFEIIMPLCNPSCKLCLSRSSDRVKCQDGPSDTIFSSLINSTLINSSLLNKTQYYLTKHHSTQLNITLLNINQLNCLNLFHYSFEFIFKFGNFTLTKIDRH